MFKYSVFTRFKKNRFTLIVICLFLLSGCQASSAPIDASSSGWFDHYFVYTFSVLIKGFAAWLGGSYGWSIILVTVLIRFALMPLMLKQMKGSFQMREKLAGLKPEMDAIKERYKNKKDSEAKTALQREIVELYQKHNLNPVGAIGCLPVLIQFPFLIGFYYAILRTPEIASHSFLWFNLGQTDMVITLVAVLIYFLQFKVTQLGMDIGQQKQMAIMGLISPVMIGMVSLNSPAALPLYWAAGGLFLILQTLLAKWLYQPKIQKKQPIRPSRQNSQ